MLLRRLTGHVKDQNWFAVALDFFIVVAGILIAFQVTNWSAERATHVEAAEYHERLISDLKREAENYVSLQKYYGDVRKAAEATLGDLSGEKPLSDKDLLVNAFRASQYNWFERYRSTFDEMTSSGKLDLIGDSKLLVSASGFYNLDMMDTLTEDGRNAGYRTAFRMRLSPDLQLALAEQCGDKADNMSLGSFTLDYNCPFEWPASQIKMAAASLRTDDALRPLLGLRIVELALAETNFEQNWDIFRLDDFLMDEARP